ncbi:hypothetical protein ASG76_07860 [Nocardioides sp. Soil774]|uniref:helix-turn-helix transcriptional regulator n=1 Tax=Nocardioides sp. Soil774 TaxID=1736408 RepID=UPI0006F3D529|nr:helix-turn-helix transcriptional regulator [Nocardioides sp. Soil774]KRE95543.1 hypothetical protein ASG76_07860 [Nocardioides sp. Soil774]
MPHTRAKRGSPDAFDFEGTGARARDWLDRAYGASLRLTGRVGTVQHRRVDHGTFAFDHLVIGSPFAADSDAMPGLVVVDLINGDSAYSRDHITDYSHDGDSVLAAGWDMPHSNSSEGFEVRATTITGQALALAVEDLLPGHPWEHISFDSYVPHSQAAGARWRALVDQLSAAVPAVQAGDPDHAGEAAAEAGRLLAHTLLATFPNDVMAEAVRLEQEAGQGESSPTLVAHAMRVVEARAGDEITLEELARECSMSPRALQYAFRKHLGCSPLDYLRLVRLDLARAALRDGSKTTVSDAAARFGFHNPGRFASDYRQVFDENPRQTLNRNPS